jgi:hypothetical protein
MILTEGNVANSSGCRRIRGWLAHSWVAGAFFDSAGVHAVFRTVRLISLLRVPACSRKRLASKMPSSKNPDCIDWANSQSKKVLIKDLETGYLSAEDAPITPETAWEHCKCVPEFAEEKVIFKQFKSNLKSLRKAFREQKRHINQQMLALEHDTQFIYKDTHNKQGVKIFRDTIADELLKEDVKNGLHNDLGCEGLFNLRDEYKNEETWDLAFFKCRVRQEESTQKFGHHMEVKRAKKAEKNATKEIKAAKKAIANMDYCDLCDDVDGNDDEVEEEDDFFDVDDGEEEEEEGAWV